MFKQWNFNTFRCIELIRSDIIIKYYNILYILKGIHLMVQDCTGKYFQCGGTYKILFKTTYAPFIFNLPLFENCPLKKNSVRPCLVDQPGKKCCHQYICTFEMWFQKFHNKHVSAEDCQLSFIYSGFGVL